jgi:hypothetical protein
MRPVPKVLGLTLVAAQQTLNTNGFELGRVDPLDADPALRVRFQNPAPGRQWRRGTPVDLALGASSTRPTQAITPGPDEGAPAPAPSPAARAALAAPLAFSDARGRVLLETRIGQPRVMLAQDGSEPAWLPDGRLAFLAIQDADHTSVVSKRPASGTPATPLTDVGPYHRPAFSPQGDVLLVVSAVNGEGSGAGALCFQPVPSHGAVPDCQQIDPEWEYGRPAWAPDGKAILALARRPGAPTYTRIVIFRRIAADGARSDAWQQAADPLLESAQIAFVAWSTTGIAVLQAASQSTAPHLTLFGPHPTTTLGTPRQHPTVTGCQLAWDPEGRLAIAERGCGAQDVDGPIRLFDPSRPDGPTVQLATAGANPAWGPPVP